VFEFQGFGCLKREPKRYELYAEFHRAGVEEFVSFSTIQGEVRIIIRCQVGLFSAKLHIVTFSVKLILDKITLLDTTDYSCQMGDTIFSG